MWNVSASWPGDRSVVDDVDLELAAVGTVTPAEDVALSVVEGDEEEEVLDLLGLGAAHVERITGRPMERCFRRKVGDVADATVSGPDEEVGADTVELGVHREEIAALTRARNST